MYDLKCLIICSRVFQSCFLPCLVLPPAGRPGNFIYMQLMDQEAFSKTGEDEAEKRARLTSLPITAPDADLCMSFWYHMSGDHVGALHIRQRKEAEGEQMLWTLRGHQDKRWREGRVLLPHSSVSYQVRLVFFLCFVCVCLCLFVFVFVCVVPPNRFKLVQHWFHVSNCFSLGVFPGGGGGCCRQTQHRSHRCGQHPDHGWAQCCGLQGCVTLIKPSSSHVLVNKSIEL